MDFLTVTLFALVGAAAQFVDGLLGMGFGITSASLLTVLGNGAVAALSVALSIAMVAEYDS